MAFGRSRSRGGLLELVLNMYVILRVVKSSVGQSRNGLPGGNQGMEGSFEGYFTVNEMSKFLVETASELSPLAKGPLVIGKSRKNVEILALCVGQCHKCAPLTLYTGYDNRVGCTAEQDGTGPDRHLDVGGVELP